MLTAKTLREVIMFGAVGLTASIIHFVTAIWLIEAIALRPWLANILAFLAAFPISLIGHSFMTFRAEDYNRATALTRKAGQRFFVLAALGAALNEASIVIFVEWLGHSHRPVLAITIISVAGFLFAASKFWAFVDVSGHGRR